MHSPRPASQRAGVPAALAFLCLAFSVLNGVAFIAPAAACACGMYSPPNGHDASVPGEAALISWGDGREDIWISLDVDSDASAGALLFPVPDAKTKVSAGSGTLFTELAELTKPPEPSHPAGDGNGRPQAGNTGSVTVQSRQRIGPLDVVVLTPSDPAALQRWLTTNGFVAKPKLNTLLAGYITDGYSFVAARIAPEKKDQPLHGLLDPLRLSFAGPADPVAVYPERLSAGATEPIKLAMYTLTERDPAVSGRNPRLSEIYNAAPRVDAGTYPGLASIMKEFPQRTVISRFAGVVQPVQIVDDYLLTQSDEPHVNKATDAAGPGSGSSDGGTSTLSAVGLGIGAIVVLGAVFTVLARARQRRAI